MTLRRATGTLLWIFGIISAFGLLANYLGWPVGAWLTPLNTLMGFSFCVLHAGQRLGWKRALFLVAVVFAVALTFESVGVATGVVYGPYHYTAKLGIKFLGLVPLLIPVAWFMMLYPSLVIAEVLTHEVMQVSATRKLMTAALAGLILTAWDLAMDPLMVAGDHWVWDAPGEYFGVPLLNFWGWWLTGFVASGFFLAATWMVDVQPHMGDIPRRWTLAAYGITGLATILSCWIHGLPGPALVGLFAMLPWPIAAALRLGSKGGKHAGKSRSDDGIIEGRV